MAACVGADPRVRRQRVPLEVQHPRPRQARVSRPGARPARLRVERQARHRLLRRDLARSGMGMIHGLKFFAERVLGYWGLIMT